MAISKIWREKPLWQAIVKRIADTAEKFAVTSLAFGLFYDSGFLCILGFLTFSLSIYLTYVLVRYI
jgi:hypothetical protein